MKYSNTLAPFRLRGVDRARRLCLAGALGALAAMPALVDAQGRGDTGFSERTYLSFVIDHHYVALRAAELAAGTDATRNAAINDPAEGTAPTPGFAATTAKAQDERIRSIARLANRTQREEIVAAQDLLRRWYGVQYQPRLSWQNRLMLMSLERQANGAQFERAFLRQFSRHHFNVLAPSLHCKVRSDLEHETLRRYCDNIVVTQTNQINEMREMLCARFNECGYVPALRQEE